MRPENCPSCGSVRAYTGIHHRNKWTDCDAEVSYRIQCADCGYIGPAADARHMANLIWDVEAAECAAGRFGREPIWDDDQRDWN